MHKKHFAQAWPTAENQCQFLLRVLLAMCSVGTGETGEQNLSSKGRWVELIVQVIMGQCDQCSSSYGSTGRVSAQGVDRPSSLWGQKTLIQLRCEEPLHRVVL